MKAETMAKYATDFNLSYSAGLNVPYKAVLSYTSYPLGNLDKNGVGIYEPISYIVKSRL